MNILELKAEMARKNISIPQLATSIGISKKALYEKLSEKTMFKQNEISSIAKKLELSDEKVLYIFFNELVS